MGDKLITDEYLVFTVCVQKSFLQIRREGDVEMGKALDRIVSEMKSQAVQLSPNLDQSCHARFLAQTLPLDHLDPNTVL